MKDNFSKQAEDYAKYRPNYPKELFEFIVKQVDEKQVAWDCATGNGQSARELAPYFEKVFATDISQKQIDIAYKADNIFYSLQPAEQTGFESHLVDLITVSQALHWFGFEQFYNEVRRVAKPGGILAVWMYSLLRITPEINTIIDRYHFVTLETYWDKERKHVDSNYAFIPFPFAKIATPSFFMEYHWTLDELEGYFNTWSALQKYLLVNGHSPVPDLIKTIRPLWKKERMKVIFPIHLMLGRVG